MTIPEACDLVIERIFAAGLCDDVCAFYIGGEPMVEANRPPVLTFVGRLESPVVLVENSFAPLDH